MALTREERQEVEYLEDRISEALRGTLIAGRLEVTYKEVEVGGLSHESEITKELIRVFTKAAWGVHQKDSSTLVFKR